MKDLFDKLSSYNLFNYLLPGTLFAAAAGRISDHTFTQGNIVVDLFVYYFIGLVISRIGSLTVGPLMRWTSFVTFAPHKDFIAASARDPRLEVLSEQNNMYRTLCALFVALPVFKGADVLVGRLGQTSDVEILIACGAFALLFAFAYRKQTQFVKERIEAGTK